MLDHMVMPVLFVVLLVLLGLVTVGGLVGIRILGARELRARSNAPHRELPGPRT